MVSDGLSVDERGLLQHLVPHGAGVGRRAQLPRQQHRLSGRRPGGRQLPARDQGDGPDRRAGPAQTSGCSARRASRYRARCSATPSSTTSSDPTSCADGCARKNRHNAVIDAAVPARAAGSRSSSATVIVLAAIDLLLPARAPRNCRRAGRRPMFNIAVHADPGRARRDRASGRCGPGSCSIYDPYFWRHERLLEARRHQPLDLQRDPVQGPACGGCSASGSAAGSSTTAAASPRRPWSRSATTACSTPARLVRCHSLEDGTFKSDHIVDRRGHARSGSAPSSTTASPSRDGAVIDADSFLMKGEEVGPCERWRGNPAAEVRG